MTIKNSDETIRKIIQALSGYGTYYKAPEDKLYFIELIRANTEKAYTNDFFKIIDSKDFFEMCVNRIIRVGEEKELNEILHKLHVNIIQF